MERQKFLKSRTILEARRNSNVTSLILNPYDQNLILMDKVHLKLDIDACMGLERKLKLDGKRENFTNFVKLISTKIDKRRVKGCLLVVTE